MNLCSTCQEIFHDIEADIKNERHKSNGRWYDGWNNRSGPSLQFEAEAESPCILCQRVSSSLTRPVRALVRKRENLNLICSVFFDGKTFNKIHISSSKDSIDLDLLLRFTVTSNLAIREIGNSNRSPVALAQCRKWLTACIADHGTCRLRIADLVDWLPTRLLDCEDGSGVLKLIESKNLNANATEYLALSHCWGKLVIITLRSWNLELFKKGISFDKLSLTFKHAVLLTRQLGYRYLWIDSLCIIQDCVEDWTYEARFMGEVYSQAACVIAATASEDGSKGLFRTRDASLSQPFTIRLDGEFLHGEYQCYGSNIWNNGVIQAPLNKRGWVVRERMLSPRTLHFGNNQIFWECRELEACEILPDGISSDLIVFAESEGTGFKRWMKAGGRSADGEYLGAQSISEAWSYVVEAYTASQLTNGGDKLIAVSGMAKKMSGLLQDDYVAGLWAKDLVNGMAWNVRNDDAKSKRALEYRAPSWSWASIDGAVSTNRGLDMYGDWIEIISFDVQQSTDDPTGSISSAHLVMRGILKPVKRPAVYDRWLARPDVGYYYPDDADESSQTESFFAVPLRNFPSREEGLLGIVVTPVSHTSASEVFKRVGFFMLHAGEDMSNIGALKASEYAKNFGLSPMEPRRTIKLI